MIFVIDNYDSFTYNLVLLLRGILPRNGSVVVRRNDETTIEQIEAAKPERIVLSPGPGRPEDAGVCIDVVKRFGARIPILGVCLGQQTIGVAFGGSVVQAPTLMHGVTSEIHHTNSSIFRGLKNPFSATRYHSLIISSKDFPKELEVTATTTDGAIMGIRHKSRPITGVQFHPESILTEEGEKLLKNWLEVK